MDENAIRLLVVEDNPGDLRLIQEYLRESQSNVRYSLTVAKRLDEALRWVDEQTFDVILLDLTLPDEYGLKTVTRLQTRTPHTPIVVTTGLADEETAIEAMRIGAQDYLVKNSLSQDTLKRAIRYALERAQINQELRDREARYRLLAENITDIISRHAPDGTIRYVSPSCRSLLGYDPEEMVGANVDHFFHPDDLGTLHSVRELSRRTLNNYVITYRMQRKDGQYVWFETLGTVNRDAKTQRVVETVAASRDITLRHNTEEKMKLLQDAVEQTGEAVVITTPELALPGPMITFVNSAFTRMTGYSFEESIGKTPRMLQNEHTDRDVMKRLREALERGETFHGEAINCRKDGTEHQVEWDITPIRDHSGRVTHFVSVQRDITGRKKMEASLRESERFARATVDALSAHIAIIDENGEIIAVNKAWREFVNIYHAAGLVEEGSNYLLLSDTAAEAGSVDARAFAAGVRAVMRGEVETFDIQYPCVEPNENQWFHARVSRFPGEGDTRIVIAHEDISEQKRAEEAISQHAAMLEQRVKQRTRELRRNKEHAEAILNNNSDAIALLDGNGSVQQINPAFHQLFRTSDEEMFGQPFEALIPTDQLGAVATMLKHVRTVHEPVRVEFEMRRKDNSLFSADVAFAPLVEAGSRQLSVICSIRDITQQKQAEAELRKALAQEKELNELKTSFTSIVSHEFRTPLSVILSSTDLLTKFSDRMSEERRLEKLIGIDRQVKRLVQLMDDVLLITRSDTKGFDFKPMAVDVAALCKDIIDETEIGYGQSVRVDFTPQDDCVIAQIDEFLFRHILQNLTSNAIKYSHKESRVQIALRCSRTMLTITVEDRGIGIPQDYQTRLFEAFHRASNVGQIKGTGIGLTIVKRAVDAHGGTIEFESVEGQGTCFTVKLPRNGIGKAS